MIPTEGVRESPVCYSGLPLLKEQKQKPARQIHFNQVMFETDGFISDLSHCCDKMPDIDDPRKEGFFHLLWDGFSSWSLAPLVLGLW